MDYSFYGGRRGASFVITGRFASIADMVAGFSQGGNYTVVNYDEYVIIDTVNKNDPDNGKVYRRGYSYQDELGGAQYVGQIVGPSGLAPKVEMTTIDVVKAMQEQEGFEYRWSEGEYAPSVNLIPGKDGETYNDSIKWACCSVRDEFNKDTTAYVGFIFPYTVIDYTADSVDPYYNRSNKTDNFTNENLVDREDDAAHPYYEKWHISVPKGIKGDAFKNFRIISAAANDNVESYDAQSGDRAGKQVATFDGEDKTRKIAVYDYYHYDKDGSGEPVSLYLGDYNMISDVAIDDDGTVRIAYSHDDDSIWENKFKWVTNISITQEGLFTINYNYGGEDTQYQTTLAWIDNVTFDDDGTIKFIYNDGQTEDVVFDKKIKWITNVVLSDDGTLTFSYNNGTKDTIFANTVRWITDVQMKQDGTVSVSYNNGDADSVWSKMIRWITAVKFNEEGTLEVDYNNDTPPDVWENLVKWISDVKIEDNGTIKVDFNNGDDSLTWSNLLKWITDISLDDNGTFTVSYNNGDAASVWSNLFKWITAIQLADDGTLTVSYNNDEPNTVFDKKIRWITDCTFTDEGDFTLKFNDGTPDVTQHITWITDMQVNTGEVEGEGNQKLHTTYNDGTEEDIGNPLNYIMRMVVTPNDYHLIVLFSDPVRRAEIVAKKQNYIYDSRNDWYDCGSIKNYNGILIGTNYDISYFKDRTNAGIIAQLNEELPNGFDVSDVERHGKMITVGVDDLNKSFFGFDYSKNENGSYRGWYYIGNFSEYPGVIAGREDDPSVAAAAMPVGSVWLVVSSAPEKIYDSDEGEE